MARGKKRTPQVEELRPYVEGVAKNLVVKLYGPQGPAWGTKRTQIEDVLIEIRDLLTEKMLDESLAKQAAASERPQAFRTCPGCQAPLPCGEANPRLLQTRAGEAEWAEPEGYCDRCRRAFFPQSRSLGIDQSETSSTLLAKITYAGTAGRSFAEASALLKQLADLPTPEKQVERLTRRIGAEGVAEREAAVAAFAALPLAEKFAAPCGVTPPELAVVMADGGRLQIRDPPQAPPSPADAPAAKAADETTLAEDEWKLQRRFFGSFTAILDFIHALSYVFAAAMAGRCFAAGWAVYEQWIGWVWQGRVNEVIAALERRQAELGEASEDEPETRPRRLVARTLTYLGNHQDKMRYDDYRRQGLPITSSHVESAVKQINQRVKGTEKFWSEEGSEAVLQLRADYLNDGEPLEAFWQRRQEAATGQRSYRRVG